METMFIAENKRGTIADYKSGKTYGKVFTFVLNHKTDRSSMKNTRTGEYIVFPNSYTIPLLDSVYDKEKNGMKIIRYLPEETETINFSEQKNEDKTYNVSLEFVRGVKHVEGADKLLLDFLMSCNFNGSNFNRNTAKSPLFYMVDAGEGLKDVVRKKKDSFELQTWCYNGDWDEVSAYARVLGIQINQLESEEVRHNLAIMAEKDPDVFKKGKDNQTNKRKHYALLAVERGILTTDPATRTVSWSNGGVISAAPPSVNPIDAFVEQSFTSQGEQVFAAIIDRLKPKKAEKAELEDAHIPEAPKEIKPLLVDTGISYDDANKLFDIALALGVITKPANNSFEYNGEKFISKNNILKKMKDDEFFLNSLRYSVKNAQN